MNKKKIAISIGILFIATMILGMIDAYTVAPLLKSPLSNIISKKTSILIGAFSILFMSIGVVGIAILFFPIIEKDNKLIAVTYLSVRIMECLLLIVGVIVYFLLLIISNRFINAGSPDVSYFQSLSVLLINARYVSYHIAMIILGIGSMLLCFSLYKSIIIPRFISIIGFIGYAMVFISAPLDLLDIIDTTSSGGMLYVPGAIFELLLLPIWLIIKGFDFSSNSSITE